MDKKLCVVVNEYNRDSVLKFAKEKGFTQLNPQYEPSNLIVFNYHGQKNRADYAKVYPTKGYWESQGHIIDLNKQGWDSFIQQFGKTFQIHNYNITIDKDLKQIVVNGRDGNFIISKEEIGKIVKRINEGPIDINSYRVSFSYNNTSISVGCLDNIPFSLVKEIAKELE